MTIKRPVGLGRNLSALLGTTTTSSMVDVTRPIPVIAIETIRPSPYQPRRVFDEIGLQELAQSIQQQGLLQPVIVRPIDPTGLHSYELLAGERRWRACQLAGMTELPAIIKMVTDEQATVIALVENLQRQDLNVMEQVRGMEQLMQSFSLTHQQVAQALCKSRSAVTNLLRLLNLPESVQQLLEQGDIDMGHARALLILDASSQVTVANEIVNRALSVREAERLVSRVKHAEQGSKETKVTVAIHPCRQQLSDWLNTQIEINPGRKMGSGQIVIYYENEKKLEEIVDKIVPSKKGSL